MTKITIGIPKNERLYPIVQSLLQNQGIICRREGRYFFSDSGKIRFVFASVIELAELLALGEIKCAFITRDHWEERVGRSMHGTTEFILSHLFNRSFPNHPRFDRNDYDYPSGRLEILKAFPQLGRCDIVFAARDNSYWTEAKRRGQDIASALITFKVPLLWGEIPRVMPCIVTRFVSLTKKYLHDRIVEHMHNKKLHFALQRKIKEVNEWRYMPYIQYVHGDEELYVVTKTSDLAVVQTETGETLRLHSLVPIETILTSHLILVGNKWLREELGSILHFDL